MKNKKANPATTYLLILLTILVVGGIIAVVFVATGTKQQAIGGEGQTNEGTSGGINIITTDSVIAVSATDAKSPGTTVALTSSQYSTGGGRLGSVTLGTTTVKPGNEVELLLVNNTAYHNVYIGKDIPGDDNVVPVVTDTQGNKVVAPIKVDTKTFPLNVQFNKNASVTQVMYYPYSGTNLANNGAGYNITGVGSIKTFIINDRIYGTDLANTQDLYCVYELENGTTASTSPQGVSVTGSGVKYLGNFKPAWYSSKTSAGTAGYWVYQLPPQTNSAEYGTTITITGLSTATTPITAATRFAKSCYTFEYFNDGNNGPTYAPADSSNNIKSMMSFSTTLFFSA